MKRWSVLFSILFLSVLLVAGCGKKSKGTGPVPVKQIINELPNLQGLMEVRSEIGVRSGFLILWDTPHASLDTLSICPGSFPIVLVSDPELGVEIDEEWGVISDTLVDVTQTGTLLMMFCQDDSCHDFDSCTVAFEVNISSRTTGQHPKPTGFQLISTFKFRDCSGAQYESLSRYTFKSLSGSPNCATQAKQGAQILLLPRSRATSL